MMTLAIPGDAVTAIMIGALFIHGLNPGTMLMIDQPDMFWFIVGAPQDSAVQKGFIMANTLARTVKPGLIGANFIGPITTALPDSGPTMRARRHI